MRRSILLLVTMVSASPLAAQSRPGAAVRALGPPSVSGTVYDSLIGAPLRGATVVVEGLAITATSDSVGHYSFPLDSIGAGKRSFSFFHPAIDTMGIAAPPRTVMIEAGVSAIVDLALPSARTIIDMICPGTGSSERTLIMGDVRDADVDKPLANALVVVQWAAMTLGASTITRLPQALSATTDSSGNYKMCGVPSRTVLRAQARKLPKRSGFIDLELEPNGVVVQEFLIGDRPVTASAPVPAAGAGTLAAGTAASPGVLPDPNAPLGKSVLTGNVTGADGKPLEGAQVLLVGTTRSAKADYKGNFRMTALPAGTQKVEVRLLSYQLRSYVVNLTPAREAHLSVILDSRAQVLDPVVVTANETEDIPGYDARKKAGLGTYFNHQQIQDGTTGSITDLFRQVAGMKVLFVGAQYQVVANRANETCTTVQWVVDGQRFDMGDLNPDDLFKPYEIQAIEVYSSPTTTPMQFAGAQANCGTIMIWTLKGHMKPKKKPPAADSTAKADSIAKSDSAAKP